MKITLRSAAAGPEFAGQAGDTIDVPAEIAAAMVAGGHAEAVPETAEAAPGPHAETAEAGPNPRS